MEVGGDLPTGLMDAAGAATPGMLGAFGRTPMYGGAQTPMYGGGSATPMHDGCEKTIFILFIKFLFQVGARTPHYGSMTPAYDGSRTPSHQPSASWDPTVANTPAHSTAHFDDEFDSMGFGGATPGSRYGGATPAMSN